MGRKQSFGFRRIFTVTLLQVSAGGLNPAGQSLTYTLPNLTYQKLQKRQNPATSFSCHGPNIVT